MNFMGDVVRKESEMKPARRFIAQAVPHDNGGYAALWAAPGMVPGLVRSPAGAVEQFEYAEDAEAAAMRRTFDVLNKPRERAGGSPERYEKMDCKEFAVELAETGITPSFFAFLYGTSQKRVLAWIDGSEPSIPHPVRLLLAIFRAFPQTLDLAERITDKFTTERKPRRID